MDFSSRVFSKAIKMVIPLILLLIKCFAAAVKCIRPKATKGNNCNCESALTLIIVWGYLSCQSLPRSKELVSFPIATSAGYCRCVPTVPACLLRRQFTTSSSRSSSSVHGRWRLATRLQTTQLWERPSHDSRLTRCCSMLTLPGKRWGIFFIDFDIMLINHVNYLLVISIILVVCHISGNCVSIDRDCNSYVDLCYSSLRCFCKSR